MLSYWERSVLLKDPDVFIIGGGIVGLSAALALKNLRPELDVLVCERGNLPSGATTRNAGFACFGSAGEILDDLAHHSAEQVADLVISRFRGLEQLRKKVGDEAMDYRSFGGYEIFLEAERDEFTAISSELKPLNDFLRSSAGFSTDVFRVCSPSEIEATGMKGVTGMIHNAYEGQINSGRMWQKLWELSVAAGVRWVCGMEVKEIVSARDSVKISLAHDINLMARSVLCCTNGFAKKLLPDIDVQPARGQVLVTSEIPGLQLCGTFHHHQGYNYFRNIDGRVLLGGGRFLDFDREQTDSHEVTSQVQEYLESLLQNHILPDISYTIEYRWAGTMGVGPEKAPIIQELSPGIFAAVRMGGMGVAIGTRVGEQAADLLLGRFII